MAEKLGSGQQTRGPRAGRGRGQRHWPREEGQGRRGARGVGVGVGGRRREARAATGEARGPLRTPSQPALRAPATLTSLGAAIPPLESSPWRGGCLCLALRPLVPGLRSDPSGVSRPPRPWRDSRLHSEPGASSPGGNNGAEAGAPEAGRGGRARVRRPGSPDRAPPALQYAAAGGGGGGGVSGFWQPEFHHPSGG